MHAEFASIETKCHKLELARVRVEAAHKASEESAPQYSTPESDARHPRVSAKSMVLDCAAQQEEKKEHEEEDDL